MGEKKRQREREKILKDWNFALAEQYGQEGQEALYQELHNMTELYLTICQDDKAYSSMILGLGKMNKNSLLSKMAQRGLYGGLRNSPGNGNGGGTGDFYQSGDRCFL